MNNSLQYPFQDSHQLGTLCKLASFNMGGHSSSPIRCADQKSERKIPGRWICLEGNSVMVSLNPFL
jgi:hypothetical protein